MGSSMLDPYTGEIHPRTDLKIGHYTSKPRSRAKPQSGPPQKDGPYNGKPKSSKPKSTVPSELRASRSDNATG